jgi:hypothetical protein
MLRSHNTRTIRILMKHLNSLKLLTAGILLTTSFSANAAEPAARPQVSLDGTWEFRMDPKDEGLAGKWFDAGVPYPDKVQVPGNWQAQGFGEPKGHLRHDYQGRAWYRRSVTVPADWAGKRIRIHLGGVTATGDVHVNGQKVGAVEDFVTPYEFDITDAVTIGAANVISIQVDSDVGCHNPHAEPVVTPGPVGMFNTWGHWGGLYRPVWLEARQDEHVDTLFVTPDTGKGLARTKIVLKRSAPGKAWEGDVTVAVTPAKGGAESSAQGKVRFAEGQAVSEPALIDVAIKDPHPWSPEDPFLYNVEARVSKEGKPGDVKTDRFGMREITVGKGGTLLLNGAPYFLRGLGDDYVEPITGTLLPDKKVYLERIRHVKKYGFNSFRFLAHTPSKEVFDAADEAGFLIMAEAPAYWNHWPRINEVVPLYKAMVPRIIREHHNHPSWYAWSAGNENGATPEWMDYVNSAHATFKATDPTRLFIASGGTPMFPMDIVTLRRMFDEESAGGTFPEQPFRGLVSEVAYFKENLTAEALARLAVPAAAYPDLVKSLKPSGYWRLNQTAPGSVPDSSGNGRDGTSALPPQSLGQPGPLPAPESGGSVQLAAGIPPLDLSGVAPSVFAAGKDPFSLSLWLNPAGFAKGDFGTPFSCGSATSFGALVVSMDGEEGAGKVMLGLFGANLLKSQASLKAGAWNHLGIVYDGVKISLFLNGQPDASVPVQLTTKPVDGRIGGLVKIKDLSAGLNEKPHIWHEFPNTYIGSLPNLSIGVQYTGVINRDPCLELKIQEVADYGLTARYPAIWKKSVDFFQLYLKEVFEDARKSPTLDGYGYWLMTDLPGGVEGDPPALGILNAFYEPEKFPDPKPILQFNRETVILMSAGGADRVLAANETKPLAFSISHYGPKAVKDGKLVWKLTDGARVVQEGAIGGVNVAPGEVREVGRIALAADNVKQAAKLVLSARLASAAVEQENAWDFWAFPAKKRDFTGSGVANLTGLRVLDARYAASTLIEPGKTRVAIAETLTPEALEFVSAGGTAILLTESGTLQKPIIMPQFWANTIRSVGYVVEDIPAMKGFPNDGTFSYQFFRLFGASLEAMDLTGKDSPEREAFTPIVWALMPDFDKTSAYQWPDPRARNKLFRCGIINEARIGKGRIIACSLRVLTGIRDGWPEAGYLLDCLLDAALSEPSTPTTKVLKPQQAEQVFKMR